MEAEHLKPSWAIVGAAEEAIRRALFFSFEGTQSRELKAVAALALKRQGYARVLPDQVESTAFHGVWFLIHADCRKGGRHGWENRIQLICDSALWRRWTRGCRPARRGVGCASRDRRAFGGRRSGRRRVVRKRFPWVATAARRHLRHMPKRSSTGSRKPPICF